MQPVQVKQDLMKVFMLKDDKSATYGMPIVYENRGRFLRDVIQDGLRSGQPLYAKHPQDFSVFEVGEFDPQSGVISMYETKNCLGLVQDFKVS